MFLSQYLYTNVYSNGFITNFYLAIILNRIQFFMKRWYPVFLVLCSEAKHFKEYRSPYILH